MNYKFEKVIEDHSEMLKELLCDFAQIKDFSVLEDFTDEELAEELCRRSSLGKELG
jgi:hypothetical protein